MFTTEFGFVWNLLVNTETETNVSKFGIIVPEFLGVVVFTHGTMCEFVNQDVENLVNLTVKADGNLPTFVCVVADSTVHAQVSRDGDTPFEHMKLFMVRILDVIPEDSILFLNLDQARGFRGLLKDPHVY
jgi:hypothetical protein